MATRTMGLTTERKVFLGLAIVAGIALVVDQGILAPKSASADAIPTNMESLPTAEPSQASEAISMPAGKPASSMLIDRLKDLPSSDIAESFGASFSLGKMIKPSPNESDQNGQDQIVTQVNDSDSFPDIAPIATDLPTLSAVMPAANGGGAVLGGKLLRIGQTGPSGYRLILVHARAVLVERDGVQYAIEMPSISGND
jgi:hypothetical protein